MRVGRAAASALVAVLALAALGGCSDDDDGEAQLQQPDLLHFEGDPGSEFCNLLREVQIDEAFQRSGYGAATIVARSGRRGVQPSSWRMRAAAA